MPAAWKRAVHPRRDRPCPWPATRVEESEAAKARALMDAAGPVIEEVLGLPGTVPELAEHARAHLRGEADPLGAAIVASVSDSENPARRGTAPYTDAWTADHGLPFAASAYVELSRITAHCTYFGGDKTWTGVRERRPNELAWAWWNTTSSGRHLRALLASADDESYREAVETLARHRVTPVQKMVVSYLVPTRDDWVDEVCALAPGSSDAEGPLRWMLLCSLGTAHQVETLGLPFVPGGAVIEVIATVVDATGPAGAVPPLAGALDETGIADHTRLLLDVLATLPADEAFQVLLDRLGRRYVPVAASAAADAFPARAIRLLASSAAADLPGTAELLRVQVITRPELVDELLPGLPDESRAVIETLRESAVRAPEPPPGTLPPLLTEPPWTRPRTQREPVVIKDLPYPGTRSIAWEPGERDAWNVDLPHWWRRVERLDWETQVARFQKGEPSSRDHLHLFVEGPEELVRPLLAGWEPSRFWDVEVGMPVIVSRFGLDALEVAVRAARQNPAKGAEVLLPYLSDEIVLLMADWLHRLKQAGATARG
ncbi:MAG: hypothetical protein ACRDNL_00515, partial [Spirillospora sp.]